jgi:predicted transcriptional regulator
MLRTMPPSWMLHRFRSDFLLENLLLLVLRLISEFERSEWEVLDQLHLRYACTPSAKEFRRVCELLETGGYVTATSTGTTRKLKVTSEGRKLLRCLEEEYRAVVSSSQA